MFRQRETISKKVRPNNSIWIRITNVWRSKLNTYCCSYSYALESTKMQTDRWYWCHFMFLRNVFDHLLLNIPLASTKEMYAIARPHKGNISYIKGRAVVSRIRYSSLWSRYFYLKSLYRYHGKKLDVKPQKHIITHIARSIDACCFKSVLRQGL